MDNQTLDLLNQFNTFKNDINQQLTDKQTNSLTTNRIILIVIGLVLLGGAFWYFSRRRIPYKPEFSSPPYDMRDGGMGNSIKRSLDEKPFNSSKDKRKPAR